MEQEAISVKNISYTYPNGFTALRDIDFTIHKQEFVAIIGQNGAGKSTLLKNIVGLYRPTQGDIIVDGMNTKDAAVAQLATKVGFVLQNPDRQLFESSVAAEVGFGPKNLGLSAEQVEERVNFALEETGLNQFRDSFPMALSAGERAKVAIASVVAMNPDIIILDEPTTGQDRRGCAQIMNLAKSFQKKGRTVVVVTHSMGLVADYAERTIALCKGKLLLDGPTKEVFAQEELLRTTFIMPPQVTQLANRIKPQLGHEETVLHTGELADLIAKRLKNSPKCQ